MKFGGNIQTALKGDTVSPQPLSSTYTLSVLPVQSIEDGPQSHENIRTPFRELIKKMPGEKKLFST